MAPRTGHGEIGNAQQDIMHLALNVGSTDHDTHRDLPFLTPAAAGPAGMLPSCKSTCGAQRAPGDRLALIGQSATCRRQPRLASDPGRSRCSPVRQVMTQPWAIPPISLA
ncbi:hypothetical protein VTI74DRAFT_3985 [Chaetomium olivicolor]